MKQLTRGQYLAIAIPFILSTVTQPLLGAVGIGIVGKLPNPVYIAGVSVGTVIFDTMYWLFGFLRVGTTAFSAQAETKTQQAAAFFRPLAIALAAGLCFLVLARVVFGGAMLMISPEAPVQQQIWRYFSVLVFGAPFVLCNYVILGWLMGRALIKASMTVQISGNVLNIFLDLLFVHGLGMNVDGVAAATLIAQIFTTLLGVFFLARNADFTGIAVKRLFVLSEMKSILRVNADLMLRTVCLLVQVNLFTATSASFGTAVLSANAILLQVQSILSYLFDGMANASSVCAGRAAGQHNERLLRLTWRRTIECGAALAVFCTAFFCLGQDFLLRLFTDQPALLEIAHRHAFWVALYPLLASGGLAFYGIFTGSGVTKPVLTSTFFSLLCFLAVRFAAVPAWGNDGIWAALLVFYLGRTVFLLPHLPQTLKKVREETI